MSPVSDAKTTKFILCEAVAVARKKEEWIFLFFPEDKDDNREGAWSRLAFTLTVSNL